MPTPCVPKPSLSVPPLPSGPVAVSLADRGGGVVVLSGVLAFATARDVHDQGRRLIAGATGDLDFDCQGGTHTDSAGVAVLIDWLAVAKRAGRHLRYQGVSDSVRAIARLSEVDGLLESGV